MGEPVPVAAWRALAVDDSIRLAVTQAGGDIDQPPISELEVCPCWTERVDPVETAPR